jgi:hypothetical protein
MFDQLRQASASIGKHAALRCFGVTVVKKGPGRLHKRGERDARPFACEKPRYNLNASGDTPEGLGKVHALVQAGCRRHRPHISAPVVSRKKRPHPLRRKKARKRIEGQRELLLPIAGKKSKDMRSVGHLIHHPPRSASRLTGATVFHHFYILCNAA